MMSFKNRICWNGEAIPQVMDTEALQVKPEFFLATHHPCIMQRMHRGKIQVSAAPMTETEFLSEFTDESKMHVHAAILGSHGCGKSHLIRWLFLHIPQTKGRRVILIPKVGTNLRDIIRMILDGMEAEPFSGYRSRLEAATADLTPTLARIQLLNEIAIAVGPEGPKARERLEDRREQEERDYVIEYLPALFQDASFRDRFLKNDSIVDQLSHHTVGSLGYERLDKPREFSVEDFDPEKWDLDVAHLNVKARQIHVELKANVGGFRERVTNWVNLNLAWALQRILRLSDDDLGRLMYDVRGTLAEQGKELVILIEDFAKLQGIDRQLLEALLVRPEQIERRLCVLRSAMAVTTGYYQGLEETVKDRIELTVNMDVEAAAKREANIEEIARFSTRYLNAVRLKEQELGKWYKEAVIADASQSPPVPVACDDCTDHAACHSAFRAIDGMGLYPFTREALHRMYHLITSDARKRFNPRLLINEILKNTLLRYESNLTKGTFPPTVMLDRFGGGKMPVPRQTELREKVPDLRFEQYWTLIELWGDPSSLSSVSPEVYEAFGLAPFKVGEVPPLPLPPPPSPPGEPPPAPEVPARLARQLGQLDDWANQGFLSQDLVTDLREDLFDHLNEYIDWDSEMLVQSFYVGTGRAFWRTSINFEQQTTRLNPTAVGLKLPLQSHRDGFRMTALGLQGMLLHEHHKHWNFKDGNRHLRAFAELLNDCSKDIVRQLRQLHTEPQLWDPVPAAVELLALGAQLRGKPYPPRNGIEDYVDALFVEWDKVDPDIDEHRSAAWRELIKVYYDLGGRVIGILKSRIACTKGGGMSAQIIDASAIVKPLEQMTEGWQPSCTIPDNIRQDFNPVARLRRRVDTLLRKAVDEEKKRYLDWCARMRQHIAPETTCNTATARVLGIARRAYDLGVLPELNIRQFDQTVTEFGGSDVNDVIEAIEEIKDCSDLKSLLSVLGRDDYVKPMLVGAEFIATVDNALSGIARRLETELGNLTGQDGIEVLQDGIGDGMRRLLDTIDAISRGDSDAA